MPIDKNPQNPFIHRFADDLKLHGMSEHTIQSYCRALRKFIEFLGHAPDQASEDQLRNYLLFITEQRKWASSTRNVALQALKLYFRNTCPRDWPVVITIGEVYTLLKLIEKPSMKCFFTVVYNLGLRLNEAIHRQIADIDSKRMMVHIHRGKGGKLNDLVTKQPCVLSLATIGVQIELMLIGLKLGPSMTFCECSAQPTSKSSAAECRWINGRL
jgi:site-specific recombinase XerD